MLSLYEHVVGIEIHTSEISLGVTLDWSGLVLRGLSSCKTELSDHINIFMCTFEMLA